MAAGAGKNKRAVWGVVLALLAVLLAACASETTPVPQPAPEATVIPAPAGYQSHSNSGADGNCHTGPGSDG